MAEKILSVFIDESGDFGPYDFHAPFYLVVAVNVITSGHSSFLIFAQT